MTDDSNLKVHTLLHTSVCSFTEMVRMVMIVMVTVNGCRRSMDVGLRLHQATETVTQ